MTEATSTSKRKLFRVRFIDRDAKDPVEVTVANVEPSHFAGMVTLSDFVFNDHKKMVILPEEDAARKRYSKTLQLHLPYHSVVFVEEFEDQPTDLKKLPFVREVASENPRGENP